MKLCHIVSRVRWRFWSRPAIVPRRARCGLATCRTR